MGMFDVNRRGGGMSPLALAVLGTLAYKALKSKGGLGGLFGAKAQTGGPAGPATNLDPGAGEAPPGVTPASGANPAAAAATGGGLGGLLNSLGGGGLASGLRDLLDRFRETGQEEKAQSWVSTGANRPIAPHELEQVLGQERIDWLMKHTGLPRDQLLAGLSTELPGAIDELTPKGQVPTDEELDRQIKH